MIHVLGEWAGECSIQVALCIIGKCIKCDIKGCQEKTVDKLFCDLSVDIN